MSCDIYTDDYATSPDCFGSMNRKARKQHKCCECGATIEKGETYRYEHGIWEGTPNSYKTCLDCISVRDVLFCTFAFKNMWQEVRSYLFDHQDEPPWAKIAQVTPRARARILYIIEHMYAEQNKADEEPNPWPTHA